MRINAHAIDAIQGLPPGLIENLIRTMTEVFAGHDTRKTIQTVDWRIQHSRSLYYPSGPQIGFNTKEIRANAKAPNQEWTEIGEWLPYLQQCKADAARRFPQQRPHYAEFDRMAEMVLSTYDQRDRDDIIVSIQSNSSLRVFYYRLRLKMDGNRIIGKGAPSQQSQWEDNRLTISNLPETVVDMLVGGPLPDLSDIIEADWTAGARISAIYRSTPGSVLIYVA